MTSTLEAIRTVSHEQQRILNAVKNQRDALTDTLQCPVEFLDEKLHIRLTYSDKLAEVLSTVTLSDLMYPEIAEAFYDAAWNGGVGIPGFGHIYTSLFGNSYVVDSMFLKHNYGARNYIAPVIAIPKKIDPERLTATAVLISSIHKVNMALVKSSQDVVIGVLDDVIEGYESTRIIFDEVLNKWAIQNQAGTRSFQHPNLSAVLLKIPTYC